MDIKDVFLCMDELYCIMIYTNVTWCNYYSFVKFYVVYFNVSSTNINARARLSRYVWYGCYNGGVVVKGIDVGRRYKKLHNLVLIFIFLDDI
jgi:hypothetical protein